MPVVPVRYVDAKDKGIFSDVESYDLPITTWSDGLNVRIKNGKIAKTLGNLKLIDLPFKPTSLTGWFNKAESSYIITGDDSRIYRHLGLDNQYNIIPLADITQADTPYSSNRWQTTVLGWGVLMNNGVDKPQVILNGESEAKDLPNWPADDNSDSQNGPFRATNIKQFSSFLVAIGINEKGVDAPYTILWSDETTQNAPPNNWNYSDPTSLAGKNIINSERGRLVDQLSLSGAHILYLEDGVYRMDYIGTPLIFSFRELFTDDGIAAEGAVASFKGLHFVVGRDNIYIHNGNEKTLIANNKVNRRFFSEVEDPTTIFCYHNPGTSEIFTFYSNERIGSNPEKLANRILIYNYEYDSWTFSTIQETLSMSEVPRFVPQTRWVDLEGISWNDLTGKTWNELHPSVEKRRTAIADYNNQKILEVDIGNSYDGETIPTFIENPKIDLDKILQSPLNQRKFIRKIYPQMSGTGNVEFTVGFSNTPSGPVKYNDMNVYNVENDYKVDTRITGRYLAIRIESDDSENNFELSGFDIEIELRGRR